MPVPENHDPTSMDAPSKNLKAADFTAGQKWTLKVRDVELLELTPRPGETARSKYALHFEGKEKRYVANVTARKSLEHMLGKQPNGWIGATIELGVFLVEHNGQMVNGFKVIAARPANAPQQAAGNDPDF